MIPRRALLAGSAILAGASLAALRLAPRDEPVRVARSGQAAQTPQRSASRPKSPIILVVGCARQPAPETPPHIWTLSNAGERAESATPAIATPEHETVRKRELGHDTYQLIGVAEFVDAGTSRKIGERAKVLTLPRVNSTGQLADGHKVAVKGLFIEGAPPRINLTSVVDLATSCP